MYRTVSTSIAMLGPTVLAAQAKTVTLCTALDDEISTRIAAARYRLQVLRLSTGDIGARILAEADNPHNDLIWSRALTSLLAMPGREREPGGPVARSDWQNRLAR